MSRQSRTSDPGRPGHEPTTNPVRAQPGTGPVASGQRGAPTEAHPTPPAQPTTTDAEEPHLAWEDRGETKAGHLAGPTPGDIFSSPGVGAGPGGPPEPAPDAELRAAETERDEYLDSLRRLQAEFENYRKRVAKSQVEQVERASGDLVAKLLGVLDTLDLALAHAADGAGSLAQVGAALTDTLSREGLERIDPEGQRFDPTEHDAVVLDPAGEDGDDAEGDPEVTEVLRAGYRWKGRVLRPAMVKVRG